MPPRFSFVLDADTRRMLEQMHRETGLSRAELLRRAVMLLYVLTGHGEEAIRAGAGAAGAAGAAEGEEP